MGEIERKVVSLPGAAVSPEVALHRTLQKVGRLKAVAIVLQWDDGTMDCDWSTMKTSELCMASMVLAEDARTVLRGDDGS